MIKLIMSLLEVYFHWLKFRYFRLFLINTAEGQISSRIILPIRTWDGLEAFTADKHIFHKRLYLPSMCLACKSKRG